MKQSDSRNFNYGDISDKLFRENEIETNRMAFKALIGLDILVGLFVTLGLLGVLSMGYAWNCWYILICCILVIPLCFGIHKLGYDHTDTKLLILAGIMLLSGSAYFSYAATTVSLIFGPTLVSIRYYNPKLVVKATIASWIIFIICIVTNYLGQKYLLMFQELHQYQQNYGWTFGKSVYTYVVLPRTLIYIAEGAIGYLIAKGGRDMVYAQAKASFQANARKNEMDTAAAVQQAAMPEKEFVSPDKNIYVNTFIRTARDVGGDFFDHFMLNDHMLVVLVADVSDKGLPSAMFGIEALSCIRFALSEGLVKNEDGNIECIDLEAAVESVNRQLAIYDMDGMFVTMWIACIDTRTGVGKFINAGHNLPLLRHPDGKVVTISNEPQLFMGSFDDVVYKALPLGLQTGDSLVIYTDGVTDMRNDGDETFGEERLKKIIKESRLKDTRESSRILCDNISEAINKHMQNQIPFDDATLVTISFNGINTDHFESYTVEADEDNTAYLIDRINESLTSVGCPENERRNLGVVVDEVCANISMYAYEDGKGTMSLGAHYGCNYIAMRFTDSGIRFNPLEEDEPDLDGEPNVGGLGIHLIKNLVDMMEYAYEGGKNILTVYKIWNM